jgi:hypothetical protein
MWPNLAIYIMPHIEQQALYTDFQEIQKQSGTTQATSQCPWVSNTATVWAKVSEASVSGYLCPSDMQGGKIASGDLPAGGGEDGYTSTDCGAAFKTNYLPFYTGYQDSHPEMELRQTANPMYYATFGPSISRKLSEVSDGLSNTLFMAEYLTGSEEGSMFGWPFFHTAGSQYLYPITSPNSSIPDNHQDTTKYCRGSISNAFPCVVGSPRRATTRSKHVGGTFGVYGDGSVHFTSNTIAVYPFRALVYIANGKKTEFP